MGLFSKIKNMFSKETTSEVELINENTDLTENEVKEVIKEKKEEKKVKTYEKGLSNIFRREKCFYIITRILMR